MSIRSYRVVSSIKLTRITLVLQYIRFSLRSLCPNDYRHTCILRSQLVIFLLLFAMQSYVIGQQAVQMHPNGYLIQRFEGNWYFEQFSPHSQRFGVCVMDVREGGSGV